MGDWSKKPVMILVVPLVSIGVLIVAASVLPDGWGFSVAIAVPILLMATLVLSRGFSRRDVVMFLVVPVATMGVMIGGAYVLPEDWGIEVVFAIPLVLIVVLALRFGFTLPDDFLPRWTKAHGITINDENHHVIKRYLLHGRRIRTVGALGGYLGYTVYIWITHKDLPFAWIVATFGGYMLGAAAAEAWALRPQPGSVRAASLTPRHVTDYLPRFAAVLLRVVPIATVLLTVTWPLVPRRVDLINNASGRPHLDSVIGWTIASVVLAILVEITARRVVNRPQPVASEELVIVDDAIRSTSLHCLAGAGLALMLGAFARNLSELGLLVHPNWLRTSMTVITVLAFVGTPFAWLHLGIDQPWVVRRSRRSEAVAA